MRPLRCTPPLRRGVDRADARGVGGSLAPGVVARWRCVSRSREWSVSDGSPRVPQACADRTRPAMHPAAPIRPRRPFAWRALPRLGPALGRLREIACRCPPSVIPPFHLVIVQDCPVHRSGGICAPHPAFSRSCWRPGSWPPARGRPRPAAAAMGSRPARRSPHRRSCSSARCCRSRRPEAISTCGCGLSGP